MPNNRARLNLPKDIARCSGGSRSRPHRLLPILFHARASGMRERRFEFNLYFACSLSGFHVPFSFRSGICLLAGSG